MSKRDLKQLRFDIDYYAILEVSHRASDAEIRRAYKRLALEAHPDKNPGRREWAEKRIRELIEAYEVLSKVETRELLDKYRSASGRDRRPEQPFFFHRRTPGARALLILHWLLNGKPEDATRLLEEQEEEFGAEYLETYLAREDYLDALFLLAEHYLEKKSSLAAAQRLRTFFHHDEGSRQRRHYYDEVVRLLKDLYLRKLPKILEAPLRITYLIEASEFRLAPKDEALRLRLLVRAYLETGAAHEARATSELLAGLVPDDPALAGLEREIAELPIEAERRRRRK